ncbi:MAG TPA: DEAD/DEAH box helicase [Terriglobia bacterium]|nr:DEAD/DEAH box helicase [Terriglobia bacterium]
MSDTENLHSPLPDITFEQLPERLRQAAERAGWKSLMPVQARAIPYLLAGRGMMIQARTGSGKTGAFVLPMIEKLDPSQAVCQALVLVPTRELARQVFQAVDTMCGGELRAVAVYGGVGYGAQIDALRQGAHIVVGTPGRILDHLLRRTLSLEDIRMFIFDEADRMLSMGFYPDMKAVQNYLPRRHVHTSMFSATFPADVIRTANQFIDDPELVSLSGEQVHVASTEHVFFTVPGMEKDRALVRVIEIENPTSAIIFCNTKVKVHYVAVVLQRFGYDADEISADLAQQSRERVLDRVRRGTLRFLVATDMAARGLDIPELSHVIQYETPEDPESYIHRAGRTGRAGASGVAISLVTDLEKLNLLRIAKQYKIDLQEKSLPTDLDVQQIVTQRVTALLEARLRQRDMVQIERSRRFGRLARELAESPEESALLAMLLDDYYQQTLHAPPPQPEEERYEPERVAPRPPEGGRRRRRR